MLPTTPRWGLTRATVAHESEWVMGHTLRRHPARVRFLPQAPGMGLHVLLQDRHGQPAGPRIPVRLPHVRAGQFALPLTTLSMGWSELVNAYVGVGVCEHVLGACVAAGLTDAVILVQYLSGTVPFVPNLRPWQQAPQVVSMPLLDGSATEYVRSIRQAGLHGHGPATPVKVGKAWTAKTVSGTSWMMVKTRKTPGWSLWLTQDESPAVWLQGQATKLKLDTDDANFTDKLDAILKARPTNSNLWKYRLYKYLAYGSGQDGGFAVVHTGNGRLLKNQQPYGLTEAIDHRALDVFGDLLAPLGAFQADIRIHYASHAAMGVFRKKLVTEAVFA